ncbi:acyltransferase [Staphylococcus condimenti]|uniref:Acyltransferase n=1 Tax=Staphylococcus condimenti TaxID=70255 RepID=A0A143PAA3_9STAP|nr:MULTISPECIES: acyltransferase [Staphylococcus]AMY05445.1 acetyltransferase [Staphylococcus condimenti]APR61650.1 acetyltransferase [Staphylococcus condimenti]MDK8644500.1 acyltransferase [Staphylococcus condimenti]OFP02583.1 acetyltransferase [Staphylococcus sp. HMSC065E08]PNZ62068.1 acyltransferase [Staphylococcus condimenti]
MRQYKKVVNHFPHANPLWHMYKIIRFPKVLKQTILIEIARFIPSLPLKRWIYRACLGMKIGRKTAFAYKVMPDVLYPELIHVGDNCVIGYNTTILTHEFLVTEYRIGEVIIGSNTLIGANTTILPGVTIGENVRVGAGTVVSKDIPDNALAFGNPMQIRK